MSKRRRNSLHSSTNEVPFGSFLSSWTVLFSIFLYLILFIYWWGGGKEADVAAKCRRTRKWEREGEEIEHFILVIAVLIFFCSLYSSISVLFYHIKVCVCISLFALTIVNRISKTSKSKFVNEFFLEIKHKTRLHNKLLTKKRNDTRMRKLSNTRRDFLSSLS